MMDLTGQADGPPTRSGVAIGDFLAGYNGAFGVMLALWERNASGLGQMVDVGLFDSTVLPVIAQAMSPRSATRGGRGGASATAAGTPSSIRSRHWTGR